MRAPRASCWVVALVAAASCVGQIDTPGANAPTAASPTTPATPPAREGAPPTCPPGPRDPGPTLMRRLTNSEYAQTVQDLLGIDVRVLVAEFPPDVRGRSFANDAESQTISGLHAYQYSVAAREIAEQALGSPVSRAAVMGCDASSGPSCLRTFIEGFGRRAYRRPLSQVEVDTAATLAATETDAGEGAKLVLRGLLQSPKFLFRPETGVSDPSRSDAIRLSGYEVATRLSYLLLGTTPDAAVLDAAAAGALDTARGVAAQARQLLANGRSREAMAAFARQWLGLEHLPSLMRDTKLYPLFTPTLGQSMSTEMDLILADVMWKEDSSFLDLFTARFGYADRQLARVYRISPPAQSFGRVDFGDSTDRGGLFTTAAFLAASVPGNGTSPIKRGKLVRETLLCSALPTPPKDVPKLQPKPGEDLAAAEAKHASDPMCAGCHDLMDPIGHGLERYDAIGALRAVYPSGKSVTRTGRIEGIAGSDFGGGVELGRLVRDSELGQRCVLTQLVTFGLGRRQVAADACTMADLFAGATASHFNFSSLVLSFVTSDAFRYRQPPSDQ